MDQFLSAEISIEIYAELNPLSSACLPDGADHVEFQRWMARSETGIVIGIALIAACVPSQEIHTGGIHLIGKCLRIEFRSDIRNFGSGVEVVKQSVFELFHPSFF